MKSVPASIARRRPESVRSDKHLECICVMEACTGSDGDAVEYLHRFDAEEVDDHVDVRKQERRGPSRARCGAPRVRRRVRACPPL